jgi:hypothetical protein
MRNASNTLRTASVDSFRLARMWSHRVFSHILLVSFISAAMAIGWSDICILSTKTCYFHPLNAAPYNIIANFVSRGGLAGDGWTILINPYSMPCDVSNCTLVDGVTDSGPDSGIFAYNFGHMIVPWSSFTIRSMVPGVKVQLHVNSAFFNNNVRSTPVCGVMTLFGQGVSVTDMHFIYSDECAEGSVTNLGAIENAQRVGITMKQSSTGTSLFKDITCDGCFTPIALIPYTTATIDTTNSIIDGVFTTHTTNCPPISFLCGACIGALQVLNIPTTHRAWWTTTMVPTGTITLFNTTAAYAGDTGIVSSTSNSIPACTISQTSLSVTTIILLVLIVMIVIHLIWSIFEAFKKKAHTRKEN